MDEYLTKSQETRIRWVLFIIFSIWLITSIVVECQATEKVRKYGRYTVGTIVSKRYVEHRHQPNYHVVYTFKYKGVIYKTHGTFRSAGEVSDKYFIQFLADSPIDCIIEHKTEVSDCFRFDDKIPDLGWSEKPICEPKTKKN
jgi:hypothetical protein